MTYVITYVVLIHVAKQCFNGETANIWWLYIDEKPGLGNTS